jgi:hypothetical protein
MCWSNWCQKSGIPKFLTVASRETKNCNLLLIAIDDERCSKYRQLNDPIGILSKTILKDWTARALHPPPFCYCCGDGGGPAKLTCTAVKYVLKEHSYIYRGQNLFTYWKIIGFLPPFSGTGFSFLSFFLLRPLHCITSLRNFNQILTTQNEKIVQPWLEHTYIQSPM